ncbi:MAG TPA: T9SS type A sorting domain-containing protein [Bacteroidia bacterium]|nr:T9SS type A sorting domain-containing protein [Bacteroidia bacterium]
MKRTLLLTALLGSLTLFSQQSTPFLIPCGGISAAPDSEADWNPSLTVIEADHSNKEANARIKDSLAALYRNKPGNGQQARLEQPPANPAATPLAPVVGDNFSGNAFNNSTPNDNEVAIANNGHLISVQNSTLFRYQTETDTSYGLQSLTLFALPLAVGGSKYDPKVIYDPEANRFIVVFLSGTTSSLTNIILGFSQSDSANGAYNLYKVPGNPFNDTLWSDYPMLAVNDKELFVTINLLHDNMSWQLGFVQTLVWQLNKWDGYNGDTLRTELHSGIEYNGRSVRNLCPVEGGSNTYQGPGMYFLSDRNLDPSNDTIFLVHVADTANSPSQQVTVTPLVSNTSYFMPPNAQQPTGSGLLATNDARILGAFIENDRVQFVCNTMDTSTGNCAVYHGIIQNVSSAPALTAQIIGDTSLEFGYPNIAYTGHLSTDYSAMIVFLHTDTFTFPGFSAIATDGNGQYSTRTTVKSGVNYLNVLSGNERWGDYSGIQRKFNAGGTCWMNGMYGTSNSAHATWIAEVGVSSDVNVPETNPVSHEAEVFPNPFIASIQVIFTNPATQVVRFVLYDLNGREVQVLLEDKIRGGKIQFSFSPRPLPAGVYLLRAETAQGAVLFTNRIVATQ